MGMKERLDRLEISLSPRHAYHHGAKERLEAKLLAVSEAHREGRQRGEEPDLADLSMGSLWGLIRSFPPGEVPPEIELVAKAKADALGVPAQLN
jgi:hypothetical protein